MSGLNTHLHRLNLLSMMILIIGFTCPPTIHFKFITKCDKWYYKVREVLQSTTFQLYRPFERTLVHTLCLADVNLQTWSLRHMLWFIDHLKIGYPLTSVINMTVFRALGFHLFAGSNTCKIWLVLKKTTLDQRIRFRVICFWQRRIITYLISKYLRSACLF